MVLWPAAQHRGEQTHPPPTDDVNRGKEPTVVWVNRSWIPRDYINKRREGDVMAQATGKGPPDGDGIENGNAGDVRTPSCLNEVAQKKEANDADDDKPKKK